VSGRGLSLQVAPKDLRGLIYAINQMDKEASGELRNEVSSISKWSAQGIIEASYYTPFPEQTAKVAATVRANRDRIPNVTIGGNKSRYSGGAVAGITLWGTEVGSYKGFPNGGRRFPFKDERGLWIFKALRQMQPEITRRWKQAVDKVLDNWSRY
jgi:hypothetical protein